MFLAETMEHQIEEAVLDGTRKDVQLAHFFVLKVPMI